MAGRPLKVSIAALVMLASVLVSPPPVNAETCYYRDADGYCSWCCESYGNSGIKNFPGYGDVCAGWSYSSCSNCYDVCSGENCTTDGNYCSPGAFHRTP